MNNTCWISRFVRNDKPSPPHHTWRWVWGVTGIRFLMAAIMLFAAVPKFFDLTGFNRDGFPPLDFHPFARSVYNYQVLPVQLVNLVAMLLVPLETLAALCLLSGIWLRAGSLLLTLLQGVFLLGMTQAILRGLNIDCGCFVGVDTRVGLLTLSRDSLFFLGFLIVFLTAHCNQPTPPQQANPTD